MTRVSECELDGHYNPAPNKCGFLGVEPDFFLRVHKLKTTNK
jgi:hypothetical protein